MTLEDDDGAESLERAVGAASDVFPAAVDVGSDAPTGGPAGEGSVEPRVPTDEPIGLTSPEELSLSDATMNEPVSGRRRQIAAAFAAPQFSTQFRDRRRYRVLGEHGRGGIGRVLRVHDRDLGRDVAIKELIERGNAEEARFLREVVITARLEHPGIVPVHEAGRWPDGTPFYAMKLVSGRPLRELLARRATVEQRLELLHHVIAVADAIAYAHGRQIIHRDLKPANVIVGEFGETVVIDWGLAKDLTTSEELASLPTRARSTDNDVTLAGAVLGTPAYMSPEQKRGEPVDQRTDVYAIGMMLWELCAIQKVPPAQPRQRHRLLRANGIDRDLAAIVNKALAPDVSQRYPDAGALAADLKAFKAGARIAARNYTLLAMLARWTQRHRALALTAGAAVAILLIGSFVFVRNIAAERDRADASEIEALHARAQAEASLDALTLNHAQLLLTTDPSAAVEALQGYHGSDRRRADQIRAEAAGRGVALVRALPHTAGIFWTQPAPDGSILTLSTDGTIARTTLDGRANVLARNGSKIVIPAYTPARKILAYSCDPADVCLFDVAHGLKLPPSDLLRDIHVAAMAFSPDGNQLVVVAQSGELRVLAIEDPARPVLRETRQAPGSIAVAFVGDDTLALATPAAVELVGPGPGSHRFAVAGFSQWDADPKVHRLAFATRDGQVVLFEGPDWHIAAQSVLCRGPTVGVQQIAKRRDLAYACRTGAVGLWDPTSNATTLRAQLEGHADAVLASPTGEYLVATGGNGTLMLIDLRTDLIASYKGHAFRLTAIAAPSAEHPFLVSADVRGGLRTWPLPQRYARLAATSSSAFHSAIFQGASVIATTWLPELTSITAGVTKPLAPHDPYSHILERAPSGRVFAAYGLSERVELWSADEMRRTQVIATGHGSVSQLGFDHRDALITSGHDGRLVRWSSTGDPEVIARADQPIDRFVGNQVTGSLVFSTADGALWRSDTAGAARSLRSGGTRVLRIVSVPERSMMYAGYANGDVVAIDTATWQQSTVLRAGGAVQDIAFSPDGRRVAVATDGGAVYAAEVASPMVAPTWTMLALRARTLAVTTDGLLVATCIDGTIWMYSIPRARWLCLPTGTVDLAPSTVSRDGAKAVAIDREGRLIAIDLDAARALLDGRAARSN